MEEKKKINRTYYCILCEMNNYPCKMTETERALTRKIKEYLLSVLNSQVKQGKLYDPSFACSIVPFYGYHLSWNKITWKKSAHILYSYFKANTLINVIKEYEIMFKETIIHDYLGALNYLYDSIISGEEIDFWKIPGIGAGLNLVPIETLEEKLKEFATLYE